MVVQAGSGHGGQEHAGAERAVSADDAGAADLCDPPVGASLQAPFQAHADDLCAALFYFTRPAVCRVLQSVFSDGRRGERHSPPVLRPGLHVKSFGTAGCRVADADVHLPV